MRVIRFSQRETDRGSRLIWREPRWSHANGRRARCYGFALAGSGVVVDRFGFVANLGQWHLYWERRDHLTLYRGRPS